MQKVLITFTNVSWQKGSAAQVYTFIREMKIVDPTIKFTLLSHCYDLDLEPATELGIETVGFPANPKWTTNKRSLILLVIRMKIILWAVLKRVGISIPLLIKNIIAEAYLNTDFVADLSGDSYRDKPGGVSIAHNIHILAARILNKPVALISQSIGPFRWYNRWLTRYTLNHLDLIYIREKRTLDILHKLRINEDKISLAPDIAFLLTKYDDTRLQQIYAKEGILKEDYERKMFGISINQLVYKIAIRERKYDYIESMFFLIKHIHEKYGATILLISHEFKPDYNGPDDLSVANILVNRIKNPSWLKIIKNNYDPCEIKTLISSLDGLVAARMHAGIAGLSSNVPTIMIAWSHKYLGLLEEIGIPEYIWNGNCQDIETLKQLFDKMIKEQVNIKLKLTKYNCYCKKPVLSQLKTIENILKAKTSIN